jgi:hypothetical protein
MTMPISMLIAPRLTMLNTNPSAVICADSNGAKDLYAFAVSLAVVITNREQIHSIEFASEKNAHKYQTSSCAEWIFHHAAQATGNELCTNSQHCFRTEPSGESGGYHHYEWETSTGKREIGFSFYSRSCIDADAERANDVNNDES